MFLLYVCSRQLSAATFAFSIKVVIRPTWNHLQMWHSIWRIEEENGHEAQTHVTLLQCVWIACPNIQKGCSSFKGFEMARSSVALINTRFILKVRLIVTYQEVYYWKRESTLLRDTQAELYDCRFCLGYKITNIFHQCVFCAGLFRCTGWAGGINGHKS